ncbi:MULTISPECIES: penicillin-binding protein 2 [unclassified Anabaena]|uniref:peptidoglycan D,D-transpeptidase FtsI family protein n=1 Tax=unclassified Anabaena TaxID=2619674 RepID=UPI001448833D|nr:MULTISPECIES: penicillin-binding protein 2 [unclassified Anabaena]MTJ07492.1 penicillin-binding protein 2 [Anabaena sp. UHCC 0204]MTJ52561.1 penicillin-binding protein 2 [Anabaena sp. UHCC 0253]
MPKPLSKTKFRNLRNLEFKRERKFSKQPQPGNIDPKIPENPPNIKSRLLLVWGVLMVSLLGLAFNLYNLQILQGKKLAERARNQQMVNVRPYMPRRPVVDRGNNMLAIDRPVYNLYTHPKLFDQSQEEIAEKIGPIIGKEKADLINIFQSKRSGILLASNVSEAIADKLISLRLNGFEFIQKYSRFYPQDDLVADVVGYVNLDRRGQAGVEYSQEKLLERSGQTVRMSRAGNGALMPDHAPEGFLNSDDLKLQLTIDNRLQRLARAALKEQMTKFSAKRGAVIVMDAVDGSLLALVSQPTYNPNRYSQADISLFKNWTVADLYEPGSTFKPVNVAIALENGAIKPDDSFEDPGSIQIGKHTIKNAERTGYRRLTIAEILQTSSNIGMVRIMQRLKPSIYYNWLERLGLGQKVDTDLPFEVSGQLKSQEKFITSNIEPATTSFGQGFSLTPLQLVQIHAALANGGKLVTPHVVRGLIDAKERIHYSIPLPEPRQIFSATTTQKVVEMMETVVSQGSGKASRISGYRIGGKTGTAQKASPNGGYIKGARITSFVAILPVESPRYVVFAVVDEPKGENAYGSTVAAPIVKNVIEALIPIEQIPPSKLTIDN